MEASAISARETAGAERCSDHTNLGSASGPPQRFWLHAAGLLVLLLLLVPLLDPGDVTIPDEGLYSAQAVTLSEGTWRAAIVAPDIDPQGKFDALFSDAIVGNERISYYRHPLYPLLLAGLYKLGGETGLVISALLGSWVAAVSGARIALRIGRRLALPTMWVLGLGSPLLFYAFHVLAHSLAAGVTGLMVLALLRSMETRSNWTICAAALAAAVLVALRTEGLVVSAAVGGAVGLSALQLRPRIAVDRRRAVAALAVLLSAALVYVIEPRVSGWLVDSVGASSTATNRDPDFIAAAWASLLRPWHHTALFATYAAALTALTVPLATLAWRVAPKRGLLPAGLLLIAAASAIWLQFEPPGLINGLLAAFPILPAGILLLDRCSLRSSAAKLSAASVAIAAPLLLATMYRDGGANQWGGRFFTVLLPLAVPLAIAGFDRASRVLTRRQSALAGVALLIVTTSYSAFSLRAMTSIQGVHRQVINATTTMSREISPDGSGLIAIAQLYSDGNSRQFWREISNGAQVLTLGGFDPLRYLVTKAAAEDEPGLVVLTDRPGIAHLTMSPALANTGWDVLESRPVEGTYLTLLWVGPVGEQA